MSVPIETEQSRRQLRELLLDLLRIRNLRVAIAVGFRVAGSVGIAAPVLFTGASLGSQGQRATFRATTEPSVEVLDTAPTWSPNGREIAFARILRTAHEARYSVLVLHVAARPRWASSIATGLFPTATPLSWAPDSGRLGIGYDAIDVFSSKGTRLRHFDVSSLGPLQFRWSPDGRWIAVISPDGTLTVIPVQSGMRLLVARDASQGTSVAGVVWTDRAHVAFIDIENELVLSSIDGSTHRTIARLPSSPPNDLTRSPNGASFAVASYASSKPAIWLIKSNGSRLRRLTTGNVPSWSPDGASIVFSRKDGVWRISTTGRALRHLAPGPASQPAWSPRGSKIVYVTKDIHCGHFGIFWMTDTGQHRARLTNGCR